MGDRSLRVLVTSTVDLKNTTHTRVHEFVNHLAKRHDLVALCLNAWWMRREDGSLLYGEEHHDGYFRNLKDEVQVIYYTQRRASPVLQDLSLARRAGRVLADTGAQEMDVHLNCSAHIAGYFVARKMKAWGIPTVFDVLDDLPEAARITPSVPAPLRYLAWRVALWALRKNSEIASKVTFVTEVLRDTYDWDRHKSELVPNGVDTQLFINKDGSEVRERLGLNSDFVLGYVGLLREWIDFEPVLAALAGLGGELPYAKLLIVGEEGRLSRVKDLAHNYGVGEKVVFAGTVPYTEVPDYIGAMDVCLHPRRTIPLSQSAFPLKVLEYMACGKPVVSTPLAGVREALGDTVLYASGSDELAAHVTRLYRDESLRNRLGTEGRRLVAQEYTWEQTCSLLEDILIETARRG